MGDVVRHVDEERLLGVDVLSRLDRLIDTHMRWVFPVAQHVQDQRAQTRELRPGLRRNARNVRAIGERQRARLILSHLTAAIQRFDAESQDRQPTVQQPQRRPPNAVQIKRPLRADHLGDQCRHERIVDVLLFLEDVAIDTAQMLEGVRLSVHGDRFFHDRVEAAHVVQPEGVIDVIVGIDDAITSHDFVSQHLLAQIGGGVDQDDARIAVGIGELNARSWSSPPVARII